MKRYAEFRKLVVDGQPLSTLIRLERVKGGLVVPDDVLEKLNKGLIGLELVEPTDQEIFDYLSKKWSAESK